MKKSWDGSLPESVIILFYNITAGSYLTTQHIINAISYHGNDIFHGCQSTTRQALKMNKARPFLVWKKQLFTLGAHAIRGGGKETKITGCRFGMKVI